MSERISLSPQSLKPTRWLCHICATLAVFVVIITPLALADTKPNILLIYVDDLGYGDMGSYGHPILKTPNLDAMAAEGVRLTNYYAPSALCSPSRAGLLTGRHPYRTGIKSWIPHNSGVYLKNAEITLAESLKETGYSTALIGKWHLNSDLGSKSEPQPTEQGFDYFYGHNAFQIPTNRNPTNIYRNKEALGIQKGFTADLYADEAIDWLEQLNSESPFFLYLSMAEPHSQFENPKDFNDQYRKFINGPVVPIPSGEPEIPKKKLIARGPGEYFANITYMDHQLGRVFDALERLDQKQNTIIVFASDNGAVTSDWRNWYEVNAYGSTGGYRGRKHDLYEGGIKVPAFVVYPGISEAGTVSDELIVGMDFFTTLLAAADVESPKDRAIDGVDVRSALAGEKIPERTLLWSLPTDSGIEHAIRDGNWKLFLDEDGSPKELYHLASDPLELLDVLNANPSEVNRLLTLFRLHSRSINSDRISRDS